MAKAGSGAEKAVKQHKIELAQAHAGDVYIEGKEIKNVYSFKYRGFNFRADGDRRQAALASMSKARTRFGPVEDLGQLTAAQECSDEAVRGWCSISARLLL